MCVCVYVSVCVRMYIHTHVCICVCVCDAYIIKCSISINSLVQRVTPRSLTVY